MSGGSGFPRPSAGAAPLDIALVQAYRETEYRVSAQTPLVLRVGEANADLAALHLAHGTVESAFVTAFNPFSERLDDEENATRHRAMCGELTRAGIAWQPAVGAHPANDWPAEQGVLMLGVDPATAQAIGRRWAQHAIVHCGPDAVPRLVLLSPTTTVVDDRRLPVAIVRPALPACAVDLGEIRSGRDAHRFAVTLDAEPLATLMAHATVGARVHELMGIERKGDLLRYLRVHALALAPRLDEALARLRRGLRVLRDEDDCDDPDDGGAADAHRNESGVPLPAFDSLFFAQWDDTEPEDLAWLRWREDPELVEYLQRLHGQVQVTRQALLDGPTFVGQIALRCIDRAHAYDLLDREAAIARSRKFTPAPPTPPLAGFLAELSRLLREGGARSACVRGGNWWVARTLAEEQHLRARLSGHDVDLAFGVHLSADAMIDNEDWESALWFHSEGLGYGDLWIELRRGGVPIHQLVEEGYREPPPIVLSPVPLEGLHHHDAVFGDGWVRYTLRARTTDCVFQPIVDGRFSRS